MTLEEAFTWRLDLCGSSRVSVGTFPRPEVRWGTEYTGTAIFGRQWVNQG
jgi:hypothetical protein